MRFLADGPEIPDELIGAEERGEVVFVCGAGVSKRVGLPLFRELVEQVYDRLGESIEGDSAEAEAWRQSQYDRVLRCLERRVSPPGVTPNRMREAVKASLRPTSQPLDSHLALLRLSRDEQLRPRVITTNFDTLFERAWHENDGEHLQSLAGAGLPAPKTARFHGVLHLHGRIDDAEFRLEETDLVLTSSEFGDAYLRSGWASRYMYDLIRCHPMVLVGYQADDPPMRYLLEAVDADRDRFPDLKTVYAFAPADTGEEDRESALWRAKGATAITYLSPEMHDHSWLYETLRQWAGYAEDPAAWRHERLTTILSQHPTKVPDHERDQAVFLLRQPGSDELLVELNPDASWLTIFQDAGLIEMEQP